MSGVCPICRQPVPSTTGVESTEVPPHFPFCSERCKLIDLGRWLDGRYQIPVAEEDADETTGADPEDSLA